MLLPDLVHELQFEASKMTVKHGNAYPGQKTGAFQARCQSRFMLMALRKSLLFKSVNYMNVHT